jgi:ectoine hydroxylase-related dioxygenase (phytanoyl-CoA dioxygenase family)
LAADRRIFGGCHRRIEGEMSMPETLATDTMTVSCKRDPDWLDLAIGALHDVGYAAITDVVGEEFLSRIRPAMYAAQEAIRAEIGVDRIDRAGDGGVVRLMMRHQPIFVDFLAIPEVLAVVDRALSSTAILRLQNGLILRPSDVTAGATFGDKFHRDFTPGIPGYPLSLNLMFAIDEYRSDNGSTRVIPRSHADATAPLPVDASHSRSVTCPAGSMILFDSTLYHSAGRNLSASDRLGINHQFTRSWIKPQIDFVRALGDDFVTALPPRTQQLLGWYTRVVANLDEYYRPEEDRVYRRNQG